MLEEREWVQESEELELVELELVEQVSEVRESHTMVWCRPWEYKSPRTLHYHNERDSIGSACC